VTEVRDRENDAQDVTYCPDNLATISTYADSIDVLVFVFGLSAHWDYRTTAESAWVEVGSDQNRADLDALLARVLDVLEPRDVPVLIFEAPTVRDNPDIVGDEPETIAMWEAVVDAWDATWAEVRKVRYADALSDPYSEQGRLERPDGVHLDRTFAEELARTVLLPRIREAWAAAIADMKAM
jgi:hypothetical protein